MKQARKGIHDRREALRQQWKDNKDLVWDKMTYADYVPDVNSYLTNAINTKDKWKAAFSAAKDLAPYMVPHPGVSMIGKYTSGLDNWGTRTVPEHIAQTPYTMGSIYSRAPMNWNTKAVAQADAAAAAQGQQGAQPMNVEQQGQP